MDVPKACSLFALEPRKKEKNNGKLCCVREGPRCYFLIHNSRALSRPWPWRPAHPRRRWWPCRRSPARWAWHHPPATPCALLLYRPSPRCCELNPSPCRGAPGRPAACRWRSRTTSATMQAADRSSPVPSPVPWTRSSSRCNPILDEVSTAFPTPIASMPARICGFG